MNTKLSTRYGFEYSFVTLEELKVNKEGGNIDRDDLYRFLKNQSIKRLKEGDVSHLGANNELCVEVQSVVNNDLVKIINNYNLVHDKLCNTPFYYDEEMLEGLGIPKSKFVNNGSEKIHNPILNTYFNRTVQVEVPNKFYNFLLNKKIKLVSRHQKLAGGGLHINIDLPKFKGKGKQRQKRLFILNFFVFMANHHYVTWIFNESCDNENAELVTGRGDFYDYLKDDDNRDLLCDSTKDYALSFKGEYGNTKDVLELRFFDMPNKVEDLENFILFVNALYDYILKITKKDLNIPLEVFYKENLKKFSRKYIRHNFPLLLEELGLFGKRYGKTYKDYRKYMSNYYERLSVYGKSHLT